MENIEYPKIKREDKLNFKLNDKQIKEIQAKHKTGQSMRSLALEFKVSRITIKYWVDESYREKDKKRIIEKVARKRLNPEVKKKMYENRAKLQREARERIPALKKFHKKELKILNNKNILSRNNNNKL